MAARAGRGELVAEHVHPRVREVAEPAGVVEVEVRDHDVAHVGRLVAERLHLRDRRLGEVQPRADRLHERAAETLRVGDVAGADPGVDEGQPVRPLHQQAVRHQVVGHDAEPGGGRAHRGAVEVPDESAHRGIVAQP